MAAIRNKYRGVTFMKAADLPELKGEVCLQFQISTESLTSIPPGLVKAGVQEAVNRQEVPN